MDRLNCFVCKEFIDDGLEGLMYHLKYNHGLTCNRGYGSRGFECGQEGCRRRFTLFSSFRRHIKKEHWKDSNNQVPDEVADDSDDFRNVYPRNIPNKAGFNDEANQEDDRNIPNKHDEKYTDFNLRLSVIRMISRLQTKTSATWTLLAEILDEFEEFFFDTVHYLKYQVEKFLENMDLNHEAPSKQLIDKFEFDSPFENLNSLQKQIDALVNHCGYIDSVEECLGYRFDEVLDSETGTYVQRKVYDTYQYVSPINVLSSVLSNEEVKDAILAEEPSEEGILGSFIDGETFKRHPFFQEYKHALRLKFYNDDIEIVNPIGSKTGPHKLGVWYYTVDNIPDHLSSRLGSIHVLCVYYALDAKKYDHHRILERFLEDLEKLESNDGVKIDLNGEEFVLRASISSFCADGLAAHEVSGPLGPSANRFCRLCLIHRRDLHEGNVQPADERTKLTFDRYLDTLKRVGLTVTATRDIQPETGVQNNCPLNFSKFFHIAMNKIFDIMHDILIGVGPMVLKLILHYFIFIRKRFTVKNFNNMIASFNYGI